MCKSRKKILFGVIFVVVCLACMIGCSLGNETDGDNAMLHFTFDYLNGNTLKDLKGNGTYEVEHIFNSAAYKESSNPILAPGVSGQALLFDGYSNYIDCANVLEGNDAYGINTWVALRAYDYPDGNMTPIAEYYSKSSDKGFVFGYTDYGKWGLRIWIAGNGWQTYYAEERLDLYKWYNLGFSFDGIEVKLYLNGDVVLSETTSLSKSTFGQEADFRLLLGCNTFNQTGGGYAYNGYSGAMDEFRLFNRVPTDEVVKKLYQDGLKNGKHPACSYEAISYPADYLSDDIYKMSYHAAPYMNWMSDLCGGFYYNGKYHMFFQKNDTGPYFRSFSWGHVVSDDMTVWKEVQPAIWPTEGYYDNIFTFSGCAVLDGNGEPYIVYTGISTNGELCNLLMAKPVDLTDPELIEWEKLDVRLTLPDGYNKGQFRDPYVYTEGDTAYLIAVTQTAAGNPCIVGWTASLNDITNWRFRGTVFEVNKNDAGIAGSMWELPQLYKLTNENGTAKYMFTMTPVPGGSIKNNCMYWLGILDTETFRFKPEESEPALLDVGNDYMCAGSGFVDPVSGKNISFALAKCAEHTSIGQMAASGWAGTVTLLREYSLALDGTLRIVPYEGYSKLHDNLLVSVKNTQAQNVDLSNVHGRALHIQLELGKLEDSNKAGLRFLSGGGTKYVEFYYEFENQRLCLNTVFAGDTNTKGYKYVDYQAGESIVLDIFIDKSSAEIYVDGKYVISSRVYLPEMCDRLSIVGDSWEVLSLEIYEMKNCYEILVNNDGR